MKDLQKAIKYMESKRIEPNDNQDIRVGDGIVVLSTGEHGIVRKRITHGDEHTITGVVADFSTGQREAWVRDFRRETFREFLTRPTGFGRTHWVLFSIIQTLVLTMLIYGVATFASGGWVAVLMAIVVDGLLVFGSWMNYTRRWV